MGWPGPGLFQLTGYFQRFGKRWHLVSWLWGLVTWIPEQADAIWGFLNEPGDPGKTLTQERNRLATGDPAPQGPVGTLGISAKPWPQFPHQVTGSGALEGAPRWFLSSQSMGNE